MARLGSVLGWVVGGRRDGSRGRCDDVAAVADEAYAKLSTAGKDPLYDETSDRAGPKFARMELIGLPWQITVGPRGVKSGTVELKRRATGEKEDLSLEAAINKVCG